MLDEMTIDKNDSSQKWQLTKMIVDKKWQYSKMTVDKKTVDKNNRRQKLL